ncbi:phosphonoacetaldehyde hydrolase [Enterococcus lactis]|uniref:phosphonoacetaldehyde hydrolase n=1 Tax=Enterococcus lactis TaxID=357441 RepID=UPI0034E96216
MIKTVIFDWAGTTVDFGCMAPVHAFRNAFLEKGIQLTDKEIREPMGKLKWDHIQQLLSLPSVKEQWIAIHGQLPQEKEVEELYQQFEHYLFKDLAQHSTLKPDTLETVEQLRSAGINIGSTTGFTAPMMAIVAETAKKGGYSPDCMATSEDVEGYGRPFPYMIHKNIQHFKNKSVDEVIKVGDTVSDIQEGKNAGVFTVGVIEGSSLMGLSYDAYQQIEMEEKDRLKQSVALRFQQAGADLCVNNLKELTEYILCADKNPE